MRRERPRRAGAAYWLLAAIVAVVLASDLRVPAPVPRHDVVAGPLAFLLAASADLGRSQRSDVAVTAQLRTLTRPDALYGWAAGRGLAVRWRPGDDWAVVAGGASEVASAFAVEVHDYRGRRGQKFYASPQQPAIPSAVGAEVAGLGRILGYTPHHESRPPVLPLDVPDRALTPTGLHNTYNLTRLAADGYTGKNQTIVFFAFDGYDQNDLDTFSSTYALPRFTPTVVGGQPDVIHGETTMDLELAHAIAPDARKVVVNARPTVQGGGAYEKIGRLLESADRQFPGAVWSFSIGWGCDKLITAADLAPVRSALRAAHSRGTTAFNASGDLAGLECRGGDDWSSPPGPADVGLDSVASVPEMTGVGGTTLSTDADGRWLGEQAWFDVPLSQGTGGGMSALFDRPDWQSGVLTDEDLPRRLSPDVAAVADPFTGVRIVLQQQDLVGGGTSQAAPLWAAMAAVMNQYLTANGGRPLGDLNPLLYRIAAGAARPAFRDIELGGNAVDSSRPGYDTATGLGSPDVGNLVLDILDIQRGAR